jgi:hypothetical protein
MGARDACAGPGCRSLEVLPPVGRIGVVVLIDSVVVAEFPLACVRDQAQNEDVDLPGFGGESC